MPPESTFPAFVIWSPEHWLPVQVAETTDAVAEVTSVHSGGKGGEGGEGGGEGGGGDGGGDGGGSGDGGSGDGGGAKGEHNTVAMLSPTADRIDGLGMQTNSMLEVDGWRKSSAVAPLKDVRSRLVENASPL